MNNLPKVATRQRGGRGSNSRPLSHQSDALATSYHELKRSILRTRSVIRQLSRPGILAVAIV